MKWELAMIYSPRKIWAMSTGKGFTLFGFRNAEDSRDPRTGLRGIDDFENFIDSCASIP
jgi:hypothetical protein